MSYKFFIARATTEMKILCFMVTLAHCKMLISAPTTNLNFIEISSCGTVLDLNRDRNKGLHLFKTPFFSSEYGCL